MVRSAAGLGKAFVHRAHARADFEADVPEQADQVSRAARRVRVARFLRQQQQEVDVGAGPQFATAVAADGSEGEVFGDAQVAPQVAQQLIDEGAARLQECERVGVFAAVAIALEDRRLLFLQACLVARQQRAAYVAVGLHGRRGCAGCGLAPADRVSTS